MKHIISFSGGAASFAVAQITAQKHGIANVLNVFCDTLIEDAGLYRFIVNGAAAVAGVSISERLAQLADTVPDLDADDMDGSLAARRQHLAQLAQLAQAEIPALVWLADGRTPWEVFEKERYIGNTRIAPCTMLLKGAVFGRWLKKKFTPEQCVLYFGFDWSEEHRLADVRKNWAPYQCEAPLCAAPFLNRAQVFQFIDDAEMDLPRLYEMDFSHNNCGGFCVKGGQAHYANLLQKMPGVYAYHEKQMEGVMKRIDTARPFLRMTVNKKLHYLTLKQYREHLQGGGEFNASDRGGCGCFSDGGLELAEAA